MCMASYSSTAETELIVDRGPEGIASTLMQKDEDNQHRKPANYTSRALTTTEMLCTSRGRESCSNVWCSLKSHVPVWNTIYSDYRQQTFGTTIQSSKMNSTSMGGSASYQIARFQLLGSISTRRKEPT